MELTNNQIIAINSALVQIQDQPIKGRLKFKILKTYQKVQEELRPIHASIRGASEEEIEEILACKQDIDLIPFEEEELESLELSLNQVMALEPMTNLWEEETDD